MRELLYLLGTAALSILCSVIGNKIDRYMQNRKERKSLHHPK
jgi:hypothetical protein